MRKKAGRNSSSLPSELNLQRLERQLQSQLHRAAAARPDDRVSCRHVRRRASATERTSGRIIHSITILSAVGIGEIRMVENVEKLRPELRVETLAEMPVLRNPRRSRFLKPESGKILRPICPECAESSVAASWNGPWRSIRSEFSEAVTQPQAVPHPRQCLHCMQHSFAELLGLSFPAE